MANEEDLVSQITVTGGPQATAEIQSFADKGSAAFAKLDKSAAASAAGVTAAAAGVEAGAAKAAQGLQKVGQTPISHNIASSIKNIENAVSDLTRKLPQLTQAIGRFTQRFALVGAAAAAGAIGLASAARNIAKQVDGESNSLEKLTTTQIDANNSALSVETAWINQASTLRQLSAQLAAGKITYSQYTQAVKDSNAQFQEQQRVAAEVEQAQRRVKEENDRLQKSLADRTAMNKLIDTFGGPLTGSLISFGRQVEGIRQDFIRAFSPSLAAGIDLLSGVISKNAGAIGKFFDIASQKLDNFVKNNGPGLQRLFESLGAAGAAVFTGLLDAAPGVIDFFNNQLIPAITKVIGFFNTAATAINALFGTKLTGGSIILIAILAQVTGSIRLLFTLLRTGSAVFKGFIGLLGEVGKAIAGAFGSKNAANVVKFGTTIAKGGGPIKSFLAIVRTAIPIVVALGEAVAVAFGISFAPAIAIVIALGVALAFLLKNVDWSAFLAEATRVIGRVIAGIQIFVAEAIRIVGRIVSGVGILNRAATQAIIDAWNAVVTFFTTTLPNGISTAFTTLWAGVTAAATFVADSVVSAWDAVVTFFTVTLPTTITTVFTTLWEAVTTGAGVAVQFVTDKWNTIVTFFQAIPGTLQSVWDTIRDAITNAFQTAVDSVTSFFTDLVAKITSLLSPVINLLKSIISLGSQAASAADGAAGGGQFAGGGRVRGPGGPTADVIPAWLSNGEFVMRARAVAKYGSAFMHAINSGQFNLPGLAMGGMAMVAPAPAYRARFAEGGLATGGRPLSLTIGGETFEGLVAPEDVADRLSRFANIRQVRSAGRKPSWVGRGK
jgi:hypothetical protein